MKRQSYGINAAINDLIETLPIKYRDDLPAIRTALNDTLDAADKNGFRVNHNYNQAKAIKRVQAGMLRR